MSLSYLMVGLLLIICTISSFTDIKSGKIYNKYLCITLILGSVLVVFYYINNKDFVIYFIFNLIGAAGISFLFYKLKVWGAGDSKLWFIICFLFPYKLYIIKDYLLFPSIYILFFIFIIAYIYVVGETLVLIIKKKNYNRPKITSIFNLRIITINPKMVLDSFFCFFLLKIFYWISNYIFQYYFWANYFLFVLLGFILSTIALKKIDKKIYKYVVIVIGCSLILVDFTSFTGIRIYEIKNFVAIFFSLIIISLRKGMSKYNYEEVLVKDIKSGMILSVATVMGFSKSRVKELPQFTDESVKYRITEENVKAIQKWEKSKYGRNSVIIVKYLPFAIFMCLGVVFYIIWCSRRLYG